MQYKIPGPKERAAGRVSKTDVERILAAHKLSGHYHMPEDSWAFDALRRGLEKHDLSEVIPSWLGDVSNMLNDLYEANRGSEYAKGVARTMERISSVLESKLSARLGADRTLSGRNPVVRSTHLIRYPVWVVREYANGKYDAVAMEDKQVSPTVNTFMEAVCFVRGAESKVTR